MAACCWFEYSTGDFSPAGPLMHSTKSISATLVFCSHFPQVEANVLRLSHTHKIIISRILSTHWPADQNSKKLRENDLVWLVEELTLLFFFFYHLRSDRQTKRIRACQQKPHELADSMSPGQIFINLTRRQARDFRKLSMIDCAAINDLNS